SADRHLPEVRRHEPGPLPATQAAEREAAVFAGEGGVMRWSKLPKPTADVGDVRSVRRFLLLPVTIGGEARWLEWATIEQKAYTRMVYLFGGAVYRCLAWRNLKWVAA